MSRLIWLTATANEKKVLKRLQREYRSRRFNCELRQ